ncbi:MAG: hypothetical protein L6R37_006929 [Teloschistes peruensis]|nr:MAG: hypothetical protein L6R37_006929 [Teloschistes peruensis]
MATVSLNSSCGVPRDNGSIRVGTPPSKTGLHDITSDMSTWRCDSVSLECASICNSSTPLMSWPHEYLPFRTSAYTKIAELQELANNTPCLDIEPPPSYSASFADSPPHYSSLSCAVLQYRPSVLNFENCLKRQWQANLHSPPPPMQSTTPAAIDWDDASSFRQATGKKNKKAQQQAEQAKWEEEATKGEGDGGDNAAGGGGSNNGDGGAGDDGGGDDWNFGGGKKKKGKKGKNALDEEEEKKKREEEKRKKEEEEEENKQKDGEETNGAAGPLAWMDDGNTKADDDWGGFTPATNKKGKKNKKKVEPVSDLKPQNAFDDINLDDTPKLDLNFGTETGTKTAGSSFSFGAVGAWGGSWDTSNTLGTGATDITDPTNTGDSGIWSLGKNKKKTTVTPAFDFGNFETLDETPEPQATAGGEQDEWGFTATSKKNKKNKKNAVEDLSDTNGVNTIGTAVTKSAAAEDTWGAWDTGTKKDKNKKKKNDPEQAIDEVPPVPPPPPPAPSEAPGEDVWSAFGTKSKKKGKKGAAEEPVTSVPDPELEAELGWGSIGAKKEKKKGKKDSIENKAAEELPVVVGGGDFDPEPKNGFDWSFSDKKDKKKTKKGVEEETVPESAIVGAPENGGAIWGEFSTGKKDQKKTKKELAEEEKAKESAAVLKPEEDAEPDLSWGGFGTKKDKKKGKKVIEEVIDPKDDSIGAEIENYDPEPFTNCGWAPFGGTKDTKKSKSGIAKDVADHTGVISFPGMAPVVEDSFGASWATTTKKGKKDKNAIISMVNEDTVASIDSTTAAEAATVDGDWTNWGTTDKKKDAKKGKKGAAEAKNEEGLPPPPPPPPVPEVPDISTFEPWGPTKKDKKGKKGKAAEPEPAKIEVPDYFAAKEEAVEEEWGSFGLSAKDKKKKEKEKKEKEKEDRERDEMEEMEKRQEEQEKKDKEAKEAKEKEKIKPGKKGKASTASTVSKTKDLLADSFPDRPSVVEEDPWEASAWGSSKKDSKIKSGRESAFAVPPPVPTPPAQGFTPPPDDDDDNLDDLLNDGWATSAPVTAKGKKDDSKASKSLSKDKAEAEKKKPEESAAKAAKSYWGGMTSTTTASKAKTAKEKKKEEEEAKAKEELDALDLDDDLDLEDIVDSFKEEPTPPPKKGAKGKLADSKLSKSTSKDDKAARSMISDKKAKAAAANNNEALIDLDEPETIDSKSKTAEAISTKSKGEEKKGDAWSFWGSSKKTSGNSGKKGDESKKEINKQEATNQNDALAFLEKEPEETFYADEPKQFPSTKSPKAAMSTSKPSAKLTVAQKVKALEEEKKKALETPPPPPTIPEPDKTEPLAKKASATSKTKAATTTTSKFARKDPSPPPTEAKKKSKDSVPGSFPAEANDEENLIDMLASTPIDKKSTKKGTKTTSKNPKPAPRDIMDFDALDVPAAPPTPPAEPEIPKPAKKERARVVRDEGASSWGFWGAAPKKDTKKATKAKDDTEVSTSKKTGTPAFVRPKPTKTPKEKDKDTEKSSASDGKEKKLESRPSKTRGSSFGFFVGPPPVRAKTVRRTSTSAISKTTSRRQSMDIDAFGLPSPPPDDAPASRGKAAKVMGTDAGKSTAKMSSKGKQKAAVVPDPYPIDDDDMVMVNGIEDPIINAPIPKKSGKSSKPKSSKPNPADAGEDIVMIDGPSQEEEPEPLAFAETPKRPAPLRRSATSAKKPTNGKLLGLFGGFAKAQRNSETQERPRTKAIVTDDEALSPRKRTVHSREDPSKRIRRDDRKVRRSGKPDRDNEVFITDALNDGGAATEYEDGEARRRERRSKKDSRASDGFVYPDRHARPNDAEKATDGSRRAKTSERRSKREDNEDSPRQEEKRSRRVEKEERSAKEAEDRPKHSSSRPHKSERRQSYMDSPKSSERPKAHRSRTEQSSSKRRSMAAANGLVNDYFDSRNGIPEEGKTEPYMHGANDHTSSWVKSQISDPADPPPVEGTVIEPTPELGGKGGYEKEEDDEARRAARKARRQSRYGPDGDPGDEDRERRRRRREGDRGGGDGRPSMGAAGKGGSWLKKVTGLAI